MPSSTVENYVKQLYLEQQRSSGHLIPMGRLATRMKVVPGTATAMVKTLAESGLVEYEPRGGVRLSEGGHRLALHVLRRHRLVEQFLVEVLNFDWSEVHEDAERLEHVISDLLLERIDALLGRPRFDPHGDPIPSPAGTVADVELEPLPSCRVGDHVVVARVLDQEAGFLRLMDRSGITPGSLLRITGFEPNADAITVQSADGKPIPLGLTAAGKIQVRVEQSAPSV